MVARTRGVRGSRNRICAVNDAFTAAGGAAGCGRSLAEAAWCQRRGGPKQWTRGGDSSGTLGIADGGAAGPGAEGAEGLAAEGGRWRGKRGAEEDATGAPLSMDSYGTINS